MAKPEHCSRPTHLLKGWTLVELLIALTIIGILAAIAYPSYLDQVRKSRRAVAKSALLDAANREEQYFFSNHQYGNLDELGYSMTNFRKDGSSTAELDSDTVYQLSATLPNDKQSFQLSATPPTENDQDNDACKTFTLTSDNIRGVTGSAPASECW